MNSIFKILSLLICLICCLVFTAVTRGYADEHGESKQHFGRDFNQTERREEGAGEASGQISAWLFGIANFPVAFSILLKAFRKVMPQSSTFKETVGQINLRQKRCLMNLHYWLNPVAVGVAIFHFMSTKCEATAIPEIGLGVMLSVCILGVMLTFRWSPAFMKKAISRFHTSPITLLAAISILVIGHAKLD